MRLLHACGTGLALFLGGCAAAPPSADHSAPTTHSAQRTATGGEAYHGLIQYRAKDAKQAIVEPVLIPATEAVLAAGTRIIGVDIKGQTRAYPLFILNNH